jgi:hypothetical protein
VTETNRYATEDLGGGKTYGGVDWEPLTVPGLKAFIAVLLYMGMKRQPNRKSYWQKEGSVFHCPIISNIMTRERFQSLTRCLHIMNPARYRVVTRMITDGRTDGRTMATGPPVTWTYCSVRYEVT